MRLLISAFACEPDRGSEPMVGWRWAMEAERLGFEVTVLTRANNRRSVEAWLADNPQCRVRFLYHDLGGPMLAIKRWPGGIYLYYYLWQLAALRWARAAHRREPFDLVHHITFVTFRFPTFLTRLGPPVILGPMGGGESSPWGARWAIGWRFGWKETLRDLINRGHSLDPVRAWLMNRADAVWATSEASRAMLPGSALRARTQISLAVAGPGAASDWRPRPLGEGPIRMLYVGQFRALKGLSLALDAAAEAKSAGLDFTLTLVGKGQEEEVWRARAEALGLGDRVRFVGWQPQAALAAIYRDHDLFLFPSTHDSGGIAPIEAMGQGLPVICLDCGGPGVSIDAGSGIKVPVDGRSGREIIRGLSEAMLALGDGDRWAEASAGAHRRAGELTWARLAGRVYGPWLARLRGTSEPS